MTNFIAKLQAFLKDLSDQPKSWLEVSDNRFSLKERPWPLPVRTKFEVEWDQVQEIFASMRDCYLRHSLTLCFFLEADSEQCFCVYEHDTNWDILFKEMLKHFPDFNINNYGEVEKFFPGEGSLPCWHYKKSIGNLRVYLEDKKVVWEDDNTIYGQWND